MLATGKEDTKIIPVSCAIFSGKAKLFKAIPASFKAKRPLAKASFALSFKVLAISAERPNSLSKLKEPFTESSLVKLLPSKISSKFAPKTFAPIPLITIWSSFKETSSVGFITPNCCFKVLRSKTFSSLGLGKLRASLKQGVNKVSSFVISVLDQSTPIPAAAKFAIKSLNSVMPPRFG